MARLPLGELVSVLLLPGPNHTKTISQGACTRLKPSPESSVKVQLGLRQPHPASLPHLNRTPTKGSPGLLVCVWGSNHRHWEASITVGSPPFQFQVFLAHNSLLLRQFLPSAPLHPVSSRLWMVAKSSCKSTDQQNQKGFQGYFPPTFPSQVGPRERWALGPNDKKSLASGEL